MHLSPSPLNQDIKWSHSLPEKLLRLCLHKAKNGQRVSNFREEHLSSLKVKSCVWIPQATSNEKWWCSAVEAGYCGMEVYSNSIESIFRALSLEHSCKLYSAYELFQETVGEKKKVPLFSLLSKGQPRNPKSLQLEDWRER